MKDEKKTKDEVEMGAEMNAGMGYMPQMGQMPQMQQMGQMPQMPQMPQMGQMGQMPMMCCPFVMNMQCPMMYNQGVAGTSMNPMMPGNPYMTSPMMSNNPYQMNPTMYNPMQGMQY